MKTASILTVSALVGLFSLAACTSATVPTTGSETSNATKGSGDTTTAKKTTTSSSSSSSGGASTTTPTAGQEDAAHKACDTCMASKSTKFAAYLKCSDTAQDQSADEKCWSDNCGTSQTSECIAVHDQCATECKAADAEDAKAGDELQKACADCVSGDATAAKIPDCLDNAQSQSAADACFTACNSSSSCAAVVQKCNDTCEFGQ